MTIGPVLIAAGAMKLYEIAFEAQDEGVSFLLSLLLAEVEICGGFWLTLKGPGSPWAQPLTIAAFAGFAASSLLRCLAGKCSCGCFGSYTVSPCTAFAFAAVAAFALLACRPSADRSGESAHPLRHLGFGLVALLIVAVGWWQADPVRVAGTVTMDGLPLREATLVFTGDTGRVSVQTDSDGRYRLSRVLPGLYAVSAPGMVKARAPKPSRAGRTATAARRAGPRPAGAAPTVTDPVLWVEITKCSEDEKAIEF